MMSNKSKYSMMFASNMPILTLVILSFNVIVEKFESDPNLNYFF